MFGDLEDRNNKELYQSTSLIHIQYLAEVNVLSCFTLMHFIQTLFDKQHKVVPDCNKYFFLQENEGNDFKYTARS